MHRLKAAAFSLVFPAAVGAIIFLAAGRVDLPWVWGVLAVLAILSMSFAAVADPSLIRERVRPGPGNRDRFTQPAGVVLLLCHWILAGLDVGRWQFTTIPGAIQCAGLVGYAIAMVVLFWAMSVNPFYSSAVRIQTDRAHRTIAAGPYQFVRHPGYAATLLGVFCGGLALGSWLALVPLAVLAILFIRRTIIEDRLLRTELAGYSEYVHRVPYRFVHGIF